jgi:hypothetical protein
MEIHIFRAAGLSLGAAAKKDRAPMNGTLQGLEILEAKTRLSRPTIPKIFLVKSFWF